MRNLEERRSMRAMKMVEERNQIRSMIEYVRKFTLKSPTCCYFNFKGTRLAFMWMDGIFNSYATTLKTTEGVMSCIIMDSKFNELSDPTFEFIFAHELGHILNGDVKESKHPTAAFAMSIFNICVTRRVCALFGKPMAIEVKADRYAIKKLGLNKNIVVNFGFEFLRIFGNTFPKRLRKSFMSELLSRYRALK